MKDFRNESIAYALATGLVLDDDRNAEKHARRMRFERKRAQRKERRS